MRFASLLPLFLAAGCIIDGTSDGTDAPSGRQPPAARTVPIVPVSRGCIEEPSVFVRSASIVEGFATIIVEHPGGCGEHAYKVCWDGYFGLTDPAQVALTVHDRTEDTCEANLTRPLIIDLAALRLGSDDGQLLEVVFSEVTSVLYL
jgi:hypothetical protein